MSSEESRPFLAGQRREVLSSLAADYARGADAAVIEKIAAGLDPDRVKLDGKGGALDGVFSTGRPGIAEMGPIGPPICFAYPGLPPKHKEGKDGKEGKEGKESKDGKEEKEGKDSKDGKEGKEGKESKEGKEGKEGKESKDGKEDKEGKESKDGKEDKDSSDAGKYGGDENQDPFDRFGDVSVLPFESFEAIAATHVERVDLAVARGSLI